jgi:hypothetical protein
MNHNLPNKLILIAPTTSPEICGVSDYALNLSLALKTSFYEIVELGLERHYKNESTMLNKIESWEVLLKCAIQNKEKVHVILNYTPRSYSTFGYAPKLIRYLKQLKTANPDNKIFIIFHELWNDDSKLKLHHRILGKASKLFANHLGTISNGMIAMTDVQKVRLKELLPNMRINNGLVGANILPQKREDGLVTSRENGVWSIFGLSHTRLWTLQKYKEFILKMSALGEVKEIRLIGPNNDQTGVLELEYIDSYFKALVINRLGSLSAKEINTELLKTSAGLIGQTGDSIKKSGTFAALAAYGVPLICDVTADLTDPLAESFFHSNELINDFTIFEKEKIQRSKKLHKWFWETRSWDAIGENIFNFMNPMKN